MMFFLFPPPVVSNFLPVFFIALKHGIDIFIGLSTMTLRSFFLRYDSSFRAHRCISVATDVSSRVQQLAVIAMEFHPMLHDPVAHTL